MVVGRWVVMAADGRKTSSDLFAFGPEVGADDAWASGDVVDTYVELVEEGSMSRRDWAAVTTQANMDVVVRTTGSSCDGYIDNLRAIQLATLTVTTTRGGSLPLLNGFGGAWGVANAEVVDLDGEAEVLEDILELAAGGAQNAVKLTTGPTTASI